MKRVTYALFCVALIAGCAAASKVPEESTSTDKREALVPTNSNEALMKGQKLFVQNCGNCHSLHSPGEYSKQKWEEILPVMIRNAKLGASERDLIHQYIVTEIESGTQK